VFDVIASGLVTGWAIAVPIGAVGAFPVALTARATWSVGATGALGIATIDGVYAALAVVGGAALGSLATGHRGRLVTGLVSAVVIAGLAIWTLLG
jgi:hypothetical protein